MDNSPRYRKSGVAAGAGYAMANLAGVRGPAPFAAVKAALRSRGLKLAWAYDVKKYERRWSSLNRNSWMVVNVVKADALDGPAEQRWVCNAFPSRVLVARLPPDRRQAIRYAVAKMRFDADRSRPMEGKE